MKDYKIKYIPKIRLNSFHPLCGTEFGRIVIREKSLPPFIDGSCRREPDFENPNPSITTLCRQEKFAPLLNPNDIVVYITVQGKWFTIDEPYRLIAILKVTNRMKTHKEAKGWYIEHNKPIPSNCMVDGNPPHNFNETVGTFKTNDDFERFKNYSPEDKERIGKKLIKDWDSEYLQKSKNNGTFIITDPYFVNYTNPPVITKSKMIDIFGKIPNTQNPNKIYQEQFKKLALIAGINIIYV